MELFLIVMFVASAGITIQLLLPQVFGVLAVFSFVFIVVSAGSAVVIMLVLLIVAILLVILGFLGFEVKS